MGRALQKFAGTDLFIGWRAPGKPRGNGLIRGMKGLRWVAVGALLGGSLCARAQGPASSASAPLPDSPGAGVQGAQAQTLKARNQQTPDQADVDPCTAADGMVVGTEDSDMGLVPEFQPCRRAVNPYDRFIDSGVATPLTVRQKGFLAIKDIVDPFNLLTIVGNSAFTVGFDAHSAYGPGLHGFGRNVGVSLLQDATGEVIGTFAVCSLSHEDPHYHRMVTGKPLRRLVHAIGRTVIAQHDDGRLMPNYENFVTYPASAEISNLYVPGIHDNGPSTVKRIFLGLATDPIGNILAEFLPDLAKRVHVRIVFVQQIINQVASGEQM